MNDMSANPWIRLQPPAETTALSKTYAAPAESEFESCDGMDGVRGMLVGVLAALAFWIAFGVAVRVFLMQ
jgi:hypothetical protein